MTARKRGDAPTISFRFASPRGVSIRACTATGSVRPDADSKPSRRRSTNARSPALSTFGTTTDRAGPPAAAQAAMSAWHQGVRGALTRTATRTAGSPDDASQADTMSRAADLASGWTESYRSSTISSASDAAAFSILRRYEPGTDKQHRRAMHSSSPVIQPSFLIYVRV